MNKLTNKYCSRTCCAVDPERNERLRQRSKGSLMPMSRQLDLAIWGDESLIGPEFARLEEAPLGLRRLAVG